MKSASAAWTGPETICPTPGAASAIVGAIDFGQHEIGAADARRERFRERSHIDDVPAAIEPLERGDGPLGIAELAVIVVFQHECAALGGEVEEAKTPLQAHGDSGGILMRRRDRDEAEARHAGERRDVDPLPVHPHGGDPCTGGDEQGAGVMVAGILHGDDVAGVGDAERGNGKAGLRRGNHHDLVGMGNDAAGAVEIGGDRLAKHRQAGAVLVGHVDGPDRPRPRGKAARPFLPREIVDRRHARLKAPRLEAAAGSRPGEIRRPLRRKRGAARLPAGLAGRLEQFLRQGGHGRAPPRARFEVAFGDELVEGGDHRSTADAEARRERAGGRQPRAGREPAVENRLKHLAIDLAFEAAFRRIERQQPGQIAV